ncbi:Ig-like domain-containing protein [Flavobacterium beibuense]|uniref:Ig-like domain-containing protein n=1 Tax=Flavobacterium beibuense TaxID=657326 RepID=UPI003A8E7CE2
MINYYTILPQKSKINVVQRVKFVLFFLFTLSMNAQQWETVGGNDIISAAGSSFNNLVIDSNGNYYVSYYDLSVSKGSVQKYDGTSWNYLGATAGITTGTATYSSLSIDSEGTVYYTNQLGWPGSGLEVRQFDGTSWLQLSNATGNSVNYQASAISASGILFTYASDTSGTVRRYSEGLWEQVGNGGFSSGATFAEMVVGSNNIVYTCNVSGGNVQVYQNSVNAGATDNWSLTGGEVVAPASSSEQYTSDIAIDNANNLFVAYVSNSSGGQKLNVKKYNGTSWIQLGQANFSSGKVQHVAIAVSPTGKVFVVASRFENDDYLKNTAYSYNEDTSTWTTLGADFISQGQATYNDLAFDVSGNYLVLAYSEGGTRIKRIAIQDDNETGCFNNDPGTVPGNTGCITFNYNGEEVSYATVRGADGNIWLQQNLGSSQTAGTVDDENSYGDLFQWGRWDDGHQKRTSATTSQLPDPNNPSGLGNGVSEYILGTWWGTGELSDEWNAQNVEATNDISGCDPCKAALGEGWKLPSQEDWTGLVEAENITNPATALASNLMLPATGYRSASSGGFTFVGQRGYYWSSTTSSTGAKYLYIGSTIANPAAGAPRGQGAAIRCVKLVQLQVTSVEVLVEDDLEPVIVTENGTLQLMATVNPITVNQQVTWSVISGNGFVTVDENGLITALANGTATIRATSVMDTTQYGEISIVVNIMSGQDCEPLTELYENFDNYSCCEMGVVPTCWESIILGGASQIISTTQPASGTSQIYQTGYGTGKISIVVLPQFSNINAGTHQFRFKVKANSGPGALDFGYITDINDASAFEIIETLTISNSTYNDANAERILTVPVTVPDNARLALRNPGSTWAGIYWDDAYWEPITEVSVAITTLNDAAPEITVQNGTLQLVAAVSPTNMQQDVIWSVISGEEFAQVDENGLVTALANGTVTVRATAVADNTTYADIVITISYDEQPTDNYCAVGVDWDVEPITLVSFAGINNTTAAAVNGTPAYENFTDVTGEVNQNETYIITVKGNTNGQFEHDIRVFIDWNQDFVFDMDTEYYATSLMPSTGEDNITATITITVPADAPLGLTRMRVIKDMWNVYEEGEFDACTNAYYGQVEDYSVNVNIAQVIIPQQLEIYVENNELPEITQNAGTLQLYATVLPGGTSQEVIWSITEGVEYAFIDESGLVTAVADGTITVLAVSVESSEVTDIIEITISGQTLGVEEFGKLNLSIYPNPVKDVLFIDSNSDVEQVAVYNLMGQLIIESQDRNINTASLSEGTYIVHVSFVSGSSVTKKIIKK